MTFSSGRGRLNWSMISDSDPKLQTLAESTLIRPGGGTGAAGRLGGPQLTPAPPPAIFRPSAQAGRPSRLHP